MKYLIASFHLGFWFSDFYICKNHPLIPLSINFAFNTVQGRTDEGAKRP